jgi:hypothetical protein
MVQTWWFKSFLKYLSITTCSRFTIFIRGITPKESEKSPFWKEIFCVPMHYSKDIHRLHHICKRLCALVITKANHLNAVVWTCFTIFMTFISGIFFKGHSGYGCVCSTMPGTWVGSLNDTEWVWEASLFSANF